VRSHPTYRQGASAEIAAATIGAAEAFGLPVSTTHVLSSSLANPYLVTSALGVADAPGYSSRHKEAYFSSGCD
jgi:phosphate/sulfate permease